MRRALALGALLALGVLWQAPGASAHALLGSSDPKANAVLQRAPDEVALRFTEEPERSLSSVEVLDLQGRAHHTGETRQDPADPLILRRSVGALDEGVYTVSWRVFSKVDGHVTGGTFAFGVRADPTEVDLGLPPPVEAPPLSALELAARSLFSAGLIGLIGAMLVGGTVYRIVPPGVWRVARWSLGLSVVGLVVLAEVQRRASGAGIATLLGTPIGRALIWRALAIVIAGTLVWVSRQIGAPTPFAGAAAVAAVLAHVSAGHAAAGETALLRVAGQWVHVVAAGIWIGGLAAVLAGLRGTDSDERARAVARFSRIAGVALFVVLGTGVVRAWGALESLDLLFTSVYGWAIVVKIVLIAVLGGLGAVNRYRNVARARTDTGPLVRVSRAEIGVASLALVAAAVLASTSPPAQASAIEAIAANPIEVAATDDAERFRVELTITPGYAGPNSFTARITDARSGALVEAERARLRFRYLDDRSLGESELVLERAEDGTYTATGGNLGVPGRWSVVVLVQTSTTSAEIALPVATKCRADAQPIEGGPTLYNTPAGSGTAQGYVDPGEVGFNEVHITFFDESGGERRIDTEPSMVASPVAGDRVEMVVRRFSQGHFVADAQLTEGVWRFDITASAQDGETMRICFNDEIGR